MSWVTSMTVAPKPPLDRQQIVLRLAADDRIERAERLVHQQHRRLGGERAGDAHPLLLAARQLVGTLVAVAGGVELEERPSARPRARAMRRRSQPSKAGTVAMFWATVRCGNRPLP